MVLTEVPKLQQIRVDEVKKFGPVPLNYSAVREVKGKLGERITYDDMNTHRPSSKDVAIKHPRSADGITLGRPISDEKYEPEDRIGFFHPPFQYHTSEWKWQFHDDWKEALAQALAGSGGERNGASITVADIEVAIEEAMKDEEPPQELHHPTDRNTVVFENEELCASIARTVCSRSVVIVCPIIRHDGLGWSRMWSEKDRPMIRARWSTGKQGHQQYIILGCLPQWFQDNERRAMWYTLSPEPAMIHIARDIWAPPNIKDLMQKLKIPKAMSETTFAWILATAHHTYTVDGEGVPRSKKGDPQFDDWIHQYAMYVQAKRHLQRAKGMGKAIVSKQPSAYMPFVFDDNLKFRGPMITWAQLCAWMTQEPMASTTLKWNAAIEAHLKYMADSTDATWEDMTSAYEAARAIPE